MQEAKAKEIVIDACKKLVVSGLIARTWGNVSCRINDEFFAITPSGRDYLSLMPKDIVVVKQKDLSYKGSIKPSSEKGAHSAVYGSKPWVNFIIHTHQPMASAVSTLGMEEMPAETIHRKLLGERVVCASYGLPGSKKLAKGIQKALSKGDGKAIIMAHHGALCMGVDEMEAFEVASCLEFACKEYLEGQYLKHSGNATFDSDEMRAYFLKSFYPQKSEPIEIKCAFGVSHSSLKRSLIVLTMSEGKEYHMDLKTGAVLFGEEEKLPQIAWLHRKIYLHRPEVKAIRQCNGADILTLSKAKIKLKPQIDDFAQLLGTHVNAVDGRKIKDVIKALSGKNAVMVEGRGAFCLGENEEGAKSGEMILQKAAMTFIYSHFFEKANMIAWHECYLMRQNYLKNYSKMVSKNKGS